MKKAFLPRDNEIWRYLSLLTQLGLNMIIPLLFFFFLSLWLDRKLDAHNIILILGVVTGVVSGFILNYRTLKPFFKRMAEKEK